MRNAPRIASGCIDGTQCIERGQGSDTPVRLRRLGSCNPGAIASDADTSDAAVTPVARYRCEAGLIGTPTHRTARGLYQIAMRHNALVQQHVVGGSLAAGP